MTTRRSFLGTVAGGLGVALAGGRLGHAAAAKKPPLGLQLYSLRKLLEKDLPGNLKMIRSWGIEEVESAGFYGRTAAEFTAELKKAGLRCRAMHQGWDALDQNLAGVIKDAETVGASTIIQPYLPHENRPFATREEMLKAASAFAKWSKQIRAAGKRFGYHIHGQEFGPAPEGTLFDLFAEETGPEVGFEMDVFWVVTGDVDPLALMKKYAGRIWYTHLKDMTKGDETGEDAKVVLGTGKIDIALAIDERADRAVKRILTELFGIMQANEDGMRRNLDSEFLHDFRVAIRRTRSCIGEMKGVFAESVVTQFAKEFAWLGALTGPTRDLDVYLLNFGEYEASLPAVSRSELAPLAAHLRRRRDEAQQLQNQGLDSDRYRRLKRKWSARLETGTDESAPNAARPIVAVAAERIGHAYARVQKHGRRIGDGTSGAAIHRVRIDCKKLRYLLEFFGSVFDPSRVATVIRSLKRLQADLGDYNDLQMQQEELKRMADELGRDGTAEARTLLAMGRLVEGLASRQRRLRRRVAKGVKTFTDDRTSAEVAALLR